LSDIILYSTKVKKETKIVAKFSIVRELYHQTIVKVMLAQFSTKIGNHSKGRALIIFL